MMLFAKLVFVILTFLILPCAAECSVNAEKNFKPTSADYREKIVPFYGEPSINFNVFQLNDGMEKGRKLGEKRASEGYYPCGQIVVNDFIKDEELKAFMRSRHFELAEAVCLDVGLIPEKKGVRIVESGAISAAIAESANVNETDASYSSAATVSATSLRVKEDVEGLSRKFTHIYIFYCKAKLPKTKFGVCMEQVDEDTAQLIGTRKAVKVTQVIPDSPAWDADVFKGDVLLELGGQKLVTPERTIEVVGELQGETTLVFWRNGKTFAKNVVFLGDPKDADAQGNRKTEIREERLAAMRASAKTQNQSKAKMSVKKNPSNTEIQKLLNMGYKPGRSEQLAVSDAQFGYSLIKMAFEEKWEPPPWTDTMRPMTIRVWFGNGGRIVNYKLESSSGDAKADQSIKSAASRVGSVPNLPTAFIDKYRSSGVPVRFTVKPQ